MPDDAQRSIVYWDTSAVISSLFADSHSDEALRWSRAGGTSVLSSLAYAETCAVTARLVREGEVGAGAARSARRSLTEGPWRRLMLTPEWSVIESLVGSWPLRGAYLWHLATAVTLRQQVPDLVLLSFDTRLAAAGAAVGLVPARFDR